MTLVWGTGSVGGGEVCDIVMGNGVGWCGGGS